MKQSAAHARPTKEETQILHVIINKYKFIAESMSMTTTLATWRCHGVGLVRGPIALMTRQPLSCRRSRRVHVRAEQDKNANDNPDNSNDPDVMGDWRSFRASLIAAEVGTPTLAGIPRHLLSHRRTSKLVFSTCSKPKNMALRRAGRTCSS